MIDYKAKKIYFDYKYLDNKHLIKYARWDSQSLNQWAFFFIFIFSLHYENSQPIVEHHMNHFVNFF